jgi:hypothetical protein
MRRIQSGRRCRGDARGDGRGCAHPPLHLKKDPCRHPTALVTLLAANSEGSKRDGIQLSSQPSNSEDSKRSGVQLLSQPSGFQLVGRLLVR